jgi:hypothetical protein
LLDSGAPPRRAARSSCSHHPERTIAYARYGRTVVNGAYGPSRRIERPPSGSVSPIAAITSRPGRSSRWERVRAGRGRCYVPSPITRAPGGSGPSRTRRPLSTGIAGARVRDHRRARLDVLMSSSRTRGLRSACAGGSPWPGSSGIAARAEPLQTLPARE